MVEHAIQHDTHSPLMRGIQHFAERRLPTEQGIHSKKVMRVVAVVGSRLENRRKIEGVHTQVGQII